MSPKEPFTYKGKWIHNWFSNMEPLDTPFVYKGCEYKTVENFYQAMKCLDDETKKKVSLMSPYEAKRFTWTIQIRPDWNEIKLQVMDFILRIKFAPGTSWAKRLLETGDEKIIEWNNWGDVELGYDINLREGQNKLGILLKHIRADLRNVKVEAEPETNTLKSVNQGNGKGGFENLCAVCIKAENGSCTAFTKKREITCINHFLNYQESCLGCQTLSSIPYHAIECQTFERVKL